MANLFDNDENKEMHHGALPGVILIIIIGFLMFCTSGCIARPGYAAAPFSWPDLGCWLWAHKWWWIVPVGLIAAVEICKSKPDNV